MTLTGKVEVSINILEELVIDDRTLKDLHELKLSWTIADGTGANQADRIYDKVRTLAGNADEDLVLVGSLENGFGDTVTFARVKLLAIQNTGDTNLAVTPAESQGWDVAFGSLDLIEPGGFVLLVARGATALAVSSGSKDSINVANLDAEDAGEYRIIVVGAST